MKAIVSIAFRDGVLDPEALAIEGSLRGLGFDALRGLRRVRRIELDIDSDDPARAEVTAREMCEKLLANPVIETYAIEIRE